MNSSRKAPAYDLLCMPVALYTAMAAVFLAAAALFVCIQGPLYHTAGFLQDAGGLTETYGVPMVVLSHIDAEPPHSLDEETVQDPETLAPAGERSSA